MQNIISHIAAQTNIDTKAVIKGLTGEGEGSASFESLLAQLGGTNLEGEMLEELSDSLLSELGSMVMPTEVMTMQQETDMPMSETTVQTESTSIQGAELQMGDGQVFGRMTDRQPMLADLGEIRDSEPRMIMPSENQQTTIQQSAVPVEESMEQPQTVEFVPTTTEPVAQSIEPQPQSNPAATQAFSTIQVENSESNEKALAERIKTEPFDGVTKGQRNETSNPFMQLINHDQTSRVRMQTTQQEAPIMAEDAKPQAKAADTSTLIENGQAIEPTKVEAKEQENPFKVLDKSLPLRAKVEEPVAEGAEFNIAKGEAPDKVTTTTVQAKETVEISNMTEIREAIQEAAMQGNDKLSVKLKPEILGGLVIEAIKDQSGGTKISIIAETMDGLEALKGKLPEIETVIKQGGNEFQSLDLSYSQDQGQGQKWEQHMPKVMRTAAPQALPNEVIQSVQTAPIYNAQGQLSLLA